MKIPGLQLGFSISATSRAPRGNEQNGREYYFLSSDEFDRRIRDNQFVEWEEVYSGTKYGTLVDEVERVTGSGRNLIMDIDVKGALNVKKKYGENALSIFILPPSMEALEERLRLRNTDSDESVKKRIEKAEMEMTFAPQYDNRVVNDQLDKAVDEVEKIISKFIGE